MGLEQDAAETGILRWMNSIRCQIAMDPSRQYFEDQVQEQGFKFLDEYWESILVRPKDPLVDLLKTPGRKHKSPTKPSQPRSYENLFAPTPAAKTSSRTNNGGTTVPKTTSWLAKAREAKALDETVSRLRNEASNGTSLVSFDVLPVLKRKSTGPIVQPEEERETKVLRMDEGLRPVEQDDGMMDGFKRMVEGLGARAGKSFGKSLGGNAAVAKAKAAAEAKIAEREASILPPPLRVFVTPEQLVQSAQAEEKPIHSTTPPEPSETEHPAIPGTFEDDTSPGQEETHTVFDDLEELMEVAQPTVTLVQSKDALKSSLTSSASSQQSLGILGQASKFVSSVLGGSKKAKTEVKSLQLAAAAAKKQQEESIKKAARLKEMENRRQLAMQKKMLTAEQEKKKDVAAPKMFKSDAQRSVPTLKQPSAPDLSAQRNAFTAADKIGKSVSSNVPKLPNVPADPPTDLIEATIDAQNAEDIAQIGHVEPTKLQNATAVETEVVVPIPHTIPTEDIELPDIRSEYSDSDDENRHRTFALPHWAQSPALRQALEQQSTINPDDIFGEIRPLRMEEMFRSRRFRARTSSANWMGADRLTLEERSEYARRMGFR